MRGKGINFDTGFLSAGTTTREPFDADIVGREMRIIRDDLHCTAVRITGAFRSGSRLPPGLRRTPDSKCGSVHSRMA
jgi:hypothetical protein